MKPADCARGGRLLWILLFGCMMSCTAEDASQPLGTSISQSTACDPTPYLAGVGLTDLNKNPVSSIGQNTNYLIEACGKVSSMCLTLTGGGVLVSGTNPSCHDNGFPSPYTPGDIGVTYYQVTTDSSGTSLTGFVTPWDACIGAQPQFNLSFTLPGTNGCFKTIRHYTCGYALPGYSCNNGRTHALVDAVSMTAAIAACHTVQPAAYSDFCYVIDSSGAVSSDISQCSDASGSWRTSNNCCNFLGTLSCPQDP